MDIQANNNNIIIIIIMNFWETKHTWLANTRALVSATFREFLDKQINIQ